MDLQHTIAQNGAYFYAIAFLWTFLEGETVVLFAGFAAAQGLLNPALVMVSAWLGSFSGDQCYFWVGRYFGVKVLRRFPRWRHGVDVALQWLERYNAVFILSFRFIYGVRNVSSFALGLSAVHWRRFLSLNFLAAALWAASFVAVGYFLGHALRAVLGDVVQTIHLGMLVVFLVIALTMAALHRLQRRRQQQRELRVPRGVNPARPRS